MSGLGAVEAISAFSSVESKVAVGYLGCGDEAIVLFLDDLDFVLFDGEFENGDQIVAHELR